MKKINLGKLIETTGVDVSLTREERERLDQVVRGYMALKPRSTPNKVPAVGASFFSIFGSRTVAAGLLIAMLFSGAGVSYAAEGTVPGDLLYQVKVSVNEEVAAVFNISSEARAEWEAERASRRLEEVTTLSLAGGLTPQFEDALVKRFEQHSEKAAEALEAIEQDDESLALNLAQDFESRLSAQGELLHEIDDVEEKLAEKIRTKVERIGSVRSRMEGRLAFESRGRETPEQEVMTTTSLLVESELSTTTKIEVLPKVDDGPRKNAVERMKQAAEKGLLNVTSAHKRVQAKLSVEDMARIDAQVAAATELMVKGTSALAADDFTTAFGTFQEASGIAQKLLVYLKAAAGIDIRARAVFLPVFDDRQRRDGRDEDDARETEHNLETEKEVEHGEKIDDGNDDESGSGGSGRNDSGDGRSIDDSP